MSGTLLRDVILRSWALLRVLSGESAYDDYLVSAQARGQAPVSRSDFYLDALRRKYDGPNRCC